MRRRGTPLAVRFWRHVQKTAGCWLWTGCEDGKGYGVIGRGGRGGKQDGAHRVSWELANGPIPPGLIVCHRCDVPMCVNPAHLFLGTHADNGADRDAKGRHRYALPPRETITKLSEGDVLAIRAAAATTSYADLAARYGVCRSNISMIVTRRNWRHV